MPYRIETSQFSFVQFAEGDSIEACGWSSADMCLPVFNTEDVWFQFVVASDTKEEADDLCENEDLITLGLVEACTDGFLLEFSQKPNRYRISDTRVRYDWTHGFPGFQNVLSVGECFHIKVLIVNQQFCSNCFQRIVDDCHTSVIQYGNNDNAFGFNYCAGATDEQQDESCEPLEIPFGPSVATMTIPWTAYLRDRYGDFPSVEVWTYEPGGELIKPGIVAELDGYPPNEIRLDFGGPSSGVIKIM
jgi:hypothetical protein